ncbi:hypothetical protein GTY83_07145 [Streptomyces sp. SID4928]|uniref:hypothetical protein n=1 Tax=unclassified Streptomyces TaxID=2593676 RepID=UPI0001C1C992|nr:hypothetical protein [Streptomyces sp. ACT-1]EGE40810.1 hypothetical protein SACT1_1445 [Streptomyces sp. ACT-1]MYR48881.1 hypothetical protein [Streptomyces sp. SID4928]
MKNLLWILLTLALLVLFPGLAQTVATTVAATVQFIAAQPILLGFGLGVATLTHLRGKNPATARI